MKLVSAGGRFSPLTADEPTGGSVQLTLSGVEDPRLGSAAAPTEGADAGEEGGVRAAS